MKKITLILFFFLFAFSLQAQVSNYNVGDTVDDFTVVDTEGNEHNLYSITAQGKYVYLDFFFVTCVPCQINQPAFSEFHDKYGCNGEEDNGGIENKVYCLSINNGNDNNAAVIQYEETFGGDFKSAPAVSNEGGSTAVDDNFGVSAYPTFCLIGPDNTLLEKDIWEGSVSVELFESTFPEGFDPQPNYCSPELAIHDINAEFNFTIYPNPVKGSNIQVVLNKNTSSSTIEIYSVLGTKVYENNFNESTFQVHQTLASGIYIMKVKTEEGEAVQRFIVN